MPTIRANDITINYELHGMGEPLLLICGLAVDLTSWFYQLDVFARHYRVIAFDNRGSGGTDKPAGPYTTAQLATDTRGLLDALGIARAHILGVSLGSMIAQEMAIACPERVNKLLLCGTSSEPSAANARLYRSWQETAPALGLPQLLRGVLLWCFTPEFFQDHPDTAQQMEAAVAATTQPLDAYLSQLNCLQTHNTTSRLGKITAPTLVLSGAKDLLNPPNQAQQVHDGIHDSKLVFTVHGGHVCFWEVPEEFNRAVLDFLAA
jgi:pimeloyl-ACP methyl ester carboxylesterase